MYTLEQLRDKTFKELKGIGNELNVFPASDRRCRQNWIDAIAGVNPPLLALLEVSPSVEVESVAEAIEIQAQEPIEIQHQVPIESKFGRIVYLKLAVQPIALAAENSPGVSFDVEEFRETHAAEIENYFASFTEADSPPNRGDNGRGRIESEPKLSQSAIVLAVETSPGVSRKTSTTHQLLELFKSSAVILEDSPAAETEAETLESAISLAAKNFLDAKADQNPILTNITFSPGFLARYSPPQSENIHYQSDADGQLSLLNFEAESVDEPPDPDDFETLNAFREAIALWDAEHPEPLEVSLNSMSEWAPCPDDWYEPDILLELSEVLELSPAIESSITCKFLIPVFDGFADRPNRQNDKDEPPDTGIFARLPGPKPPKFPPMVVAEGDGVPPRKLRTNGKQFARSAILLSGRAPPGGDAMS